MDKSELKQERKARRAKTRRQVRKNKKFWVIVTEAVVVIILLLVLILALLAGGVLKKASFLNFGKGDAGINSDINSGVLQAMEGYTNIALFGLDNRKTGNYEWGNSDVIMIASINNKTKEVKLVSIYRDTTLNIGAVYGGITEQGINKANSAYAYGGYKAAVQMLNANLDLDIQDFVVVDWAAVTKAVDALGGVDIKIDKSELKSLNKCIREINKSVGGNSPEIYETGKQHLDGVQATAFSRIRKTEGSDFRRAGRQRIVLEAMLKKAKSADWGTLYALINDVMGDIATSFELPEIINLAKDVASYEIGETSGFPTYLTTSEKFYSCVIPLTLESNVKSLHEFLFDNTDYVASDTVKSISETIKEVTGTDENTKTDYDVSGFNDTVNKEGAFD